MRGPWDEGISRRGLLGLGLSGAALLALPGFGRREAWGQTANPHLLVTFFGDGGWDVTQVFDVHDPLDATDGVDVDVPQAISGLPPSVIATSTGGLTYMSNPVTRPMVDTFFTRWGDRSAIVNGINTRSTSHDQSRQLVLTGYLDPTRADFAVMAAHRNGPEMPLPHLLLSGPSFGGPFSGLSGRVGGQLGNALAYNRIPSRTTPNQSQLAVSALGEAYVQQALEAQRAADTGGALAGKVGQFREANVRGDKLVRLASSLPRNSNDGAQLATAVGAAFRAGLTTSVTVENVGGFDTHSDNTQQNARWQQLFTFLDQFVGSLATQPGVASSTLLEETTVVYCSEFARTPQLNGDNGKDHHPFTSILLVGKGVRGGASVGMTDRDQEGVKVNLTTGLPDDSGQILDVQNMVAGILTLVGANARQYLPTVTPFTAMIA
jgi:uncharacterized protein (DUF1501 family)